MDGLRINGGRRLNGSVAVGGAKNAALPILAASILAEVPVTLDRVPRVRDVATMRALLEDLGVASTWEDDHRLSIETFDSAPIRAGRRYVGRMRASFCVLGPLLARRGRAVVALPGGCRIGPRPVDVHLRGLAALGAEIRLSRGFVVAEAKQLRGAQINLQGPNGTTVTGTANVLCAATCAIGTTVLEHAAREPEIIDLGRFLISLGADIDGLGESTIIVRGQPALGGATHRVIADRIEAGTFLIAVATAGGRARIEGADANHLASVTELLKQAGASIESGPNLITIAMNDRPQPFNAIATPYPGLPTDLQAPLMALAGLADGTSTIRDDVFPHRWQHVDELARFGAKIAVDGPIATIRGNERFTAANVHAPDLRAGAALAIAALSTAGESTISGVEHIERGYEDFAAKLRRLGAAVDQRSTVTSPCTTSETAGSFST